MYAVYRSRSVYNDWLYIVHICYLAGFIESWGRGVEKICKSCLEDIVPLAEYDIPGSSVMIKVIAPEDSLHTYAGLTDKPGISRKTISLRIKHLKKKEFSSELAQIQKVLGK